MPRLICTVRACGLPLERVERTLRCPGGHAFDRAREGYWNLLQPADRRSRRAGDAPEAIAARRRWLERGFVAGLVEAVRGAAGVRDLAPGVIVVDLGCGDGWFDERVFADADVDLCGIDLAATAVGLAARRVPGATWIVANADRGLPLATATVGLALSVFGRRPAVELVRVLRPGGRLVVVVPGEDDLAELRDAALGSRRPKERTAKVVEDLGAAGCEALRSESWRSRAAHDRTAVADALAMTYRGARRSERERLQVRIGGIESIDVTLSAEILIFKPAGARARRPSTVRRAR